MSDFVDALLKFLLSSVRYEIVNTLHYWQHILNFGQGAQVRNSTGNPAPPRLREAEVLQLLAANS